MMSGSFKNVIENLLRHYIVVIYLLSWRRSAGMNFADSMRLQDYINKVVSQEREKDVIYCLWIE